MTLDLFKPKSIRTNQNFKLVKVNVFFFIILYIIINSIIKIILFKNVKKKYNVYTNYQWTYYYKIMVLMQLKY